MPKKLLKTYKFYDVKGRRVAIYGEVEEGWINVYAVPCSIKDQFSKKEADSLFTQAKGTGKYRMGYIPLPSDSIKKWFLLYCNENFQKPQRTVERFEVEYVKNGRKKRILQRVKAIRKLDMHG